MNIKEFKKDNLIIFDGAIGTMIEYHIRLKKDFNVYTGCNEYLNITRPGIIENIHSEYYAAGADIIETNTFGANNIVLKEYGLEKETYNINRKAVETAKKARANFHGKHNPKFIAGSIGPSTKLPTLAQITFDEMYKAYKPQVEAFIDTGIDIFIIETCQDLLQIKILLILIKDMLKLKRKDIPVMVSVSLTDSGVLLAGSELTAVIDSIKMYGLFSFGLNCSSGPSNLDKELKVINRNFNNRISCIPNAGIPENKHGKIVYSSNPEKFSAELEKYINEYGVSIIGGCCGTTPEYIKCMHKRFKTIKIRKKTVKYKPSVTSNYNRVNLRSKHPPLIVAERTNVQGSKLFREKLLNNKYDEMVDTTLHYQEKADIIDIALAYTGRDEVKDTKIFYNKLRYRIKTPIMIDSTNVKAIETVLKLYGGHNIINSINLEDGEKSFSKICGLAKKYGAALVALTIDEKGMAKTSDRKTQIAERICSLAVGKYGLDISDIIIDPLTFTVGSGETGLRDSAKHTIEAIRLIKKRIPGISTILGVSNVSFGLNRELRPILNSLYLHYAAENGLDLAIVNPDEIFKITKFRKKEITLAEDLIFNRVTPGHDPLKKFISYFIESPVELDREEFIKLPDKDKLKEMVIKGQKKDLKKILDNLLEKQDAVSIIDGILLDAMNMVGDMYSAGKLQMPFLLESAEVMKHSINYLENFMDKTSIKKKGAIILATVKGDVHDIGKNLVDIIMSNNGFKVHNLGIKVPVEIILKKCKETKPDAIGLSGLLVKSTVVMIEYLKFLSDNNINIPVLLGGAALKENFVNTECRRHYQNVYYCKDAFEGLKTINKITSIRVKPKKPVVIKTKPPEKRISRQDKIIDIEIPKPPFWGTRIFDSSKLDLKTLYEYIHKSALFRRQWGFSRGKLKKEKYKELEENKIFPLFNRIKKECEQNNIIKPAAIYGFFRCYTEDNKLIVIKNKNKKIEFNLPRKKSGPKISIADYFKKRESGITDVIAFQIVTVGKEVEKITRKYFNQDRYSDYFYIHGFSVELTEALAEYIHKIIRKEWGIDKEDSKTIKGLFKMQYRGTRYSFGYPPCPDISENKKILDLLKADRIGISITENFQMVPEQTTSAFIAHHPDSNYFTLT